MASTGNSYTHKEIGRRLKGLGYTMGTEKGLAVVKSGDGKRTLATLPKQEPVPIALLKPILEQLNVKPREWNGEREANPAASAVASGEIIPTPVSCGDRETLRNWYLTGIDGENGALKADVWRGDRYDFETFAVRSIRYDPCSSYARLPGVTGVVELDAEHADRFFSASLDAFHEYLAKHASIVTRRNQ